MAEEASRSARTLGIVSVVVAGSLFLLWLVLFFVMFDNFTDYMPPPR